MSPAVLNCLHRCQFCWRDLDYTISTEVKNPNDPIEIIQGCIKEHIKYLQGFRGNIDLDKEKFIEALSPKHFAISLAGEPTLFPYLKEMIKELTKRNITSFLVTNGLNPDSLKNLRPTQLYVTLPAPNEEIYKKVCKPVIKDGWNRLLKSLKLLKNFERGTIRLTLVKNLNMINPEEFASLLKNTKFKFLELKAAMPVGYAQYRMNYEDMPTHTEIKNFALEIANINKLKIIDEKKESRVVLLSKKDYKDRFLKIL